MSRASTRRRSAQRAQAAEDVRSPGASATPVGRHADETVLPPRERPARPALVELAAAILIVGGAMSTVASFLVLARMGEQGTDPGAVGLISLGLGVLGIVLGLLTRTGRAWIVTINVVAVMGFLELVSFTPAGLLLGASDVFVVIALLLTRPWFTWGESDEGAESEDADGA